MGGVEVSSGELFDEPRVFIDDRRDFGAGEGEGVRAGGAWGKDEADILVVAARNEGAGVARGEGGVFGDDLAGEGAPLLFSERRRGRPEALFDSNRIDGHEAKLSAGGLREV